MTSYVEQAEKIQSLINDKVQFILDLNKSKDTEENKNKYRENLQWHIKSLKASLQSLRRRTILK